MLRNSFIGFTLLGITLSATSAFADHLDNYPRDDEPRQNQFRKLSPYLGGGFGVGGDEIGRFSDGNGDIETVSSGGGFLIEAGLQVAIDPWSKLRFTAGYQADEVSRLNGDSTFERTRFDAMLLRNAGIHEFGAGLTAHTSVNYHCDISTVCSGDVEFEPAVGYTLEYALRIASPANYLGRGRRDYNAPAFRLGVRFTGIEYTPRLQNVTVNDVTKANSLIGFVGFSF